MSGWELVRARARLADTAVTASAVTLAMSCLIPLFSNLSWVLPAITAVVAIALLGAASRAIDMPIPLVPVVEVIGLVTVITMMFAREQAWGGMLPTSEALDALRILTQQGLVDAEAYVAPVTPFPGLVLLAVGGAGLAALSADTLFVSVRSPILAGIPIAALYLAPAMMNLNGAPWWTFPAAAAAWLMILAADQRELVRTWAGAADSTRVQGMSTVARWAGLAAIVVSLLAAFVLPVRASAPWRSGGDGTGGGPAASGPVILDPLVSMRRSLILATDTEVLRYTTSDPQPSYLRVAALEEFDGVTWRPREGLASGRVRGVELPGSILDQLTTASPTYHVRGGASYPYDISVTSLQNTYLPLPYPITDVEDQSDLGSNWRLDPDTGIAFSAETPATGLSYRVTAVDPSVQAGELRGASAPRGGNWPQLSVPSGMSPQVKRLALEVTAGADTAYDKAVALQRWFTRDGGFEYSTSVRSGADADYIAEFLRDRIGYCEQYAATMAIMSRMLGIPSRVVVGFTQGSPATDGTWRVTVRDAHAWPELWFDDVGWVRFEPTPRADATVSTPDYAPVPELGSSTPVPADRDSRFLRFDQNDVGAATASTSSRGTLVAAVVGALVLVCLGALAWPMVRRLVRRRRRLHAREYRDVVNGAWDEVADSAVDAGQPWPAFGTPRQAGDRLSRGMSGPAADALRRLRSEVEQVRYARDHGMQASERAGAVRADVRTVRAEISGRVRLRTRLLAYCWPPSERRRQRSSMRSMKPGDFAERGAEGLVGADASSAGRTWNDE